MKTKSFYKTSASVSVFFTPSLRKREILVTNRIMGKYNSICLKKHKKTEALTLRSNFLHSIVSHFEQLLRLFFLKSLPNFVPVANLNRLKSLISSHFYDFLLYSNSTVPGGFEVRS